MPYKFSPYRFLKKFSGKPCRAFATAEVMIMMVAITLIITASFGAKHSSYVSYRQIIHRERAQLFLSETVETLQHINLSQQQVNFPNSWARSFGRMTSAGYYALQPVLSTDNTPQLDYSLVPIASCTPAAPTNVISEPLLGENRDPKQSYNASCDVYRFYNAFVDDNDGFYTRLARRIYITPLSYTDFSAAGGREIPNDIDPGDTGAIEVKIKVCWGKSFLDDGQCEEIKVILSDHTKPAYVL